jgi:hypothetical protein
VPGSTVIENYEPSDEGWGVVIGPSSVRSTAPARRPNYPQKFRTTSGMQKLPPTPSSGPPQALARPGPPTGVRSPLARASDTSMARMTPS